MDLPRDAARLLKARNDFVERDATVTFEPVRDCTVTFGAEGEARDLSRREKAHRA
ncbi:hypothetical protein NJB14197_30850 [Mycobacterium montefiorense]|uniref:Uncharacterized protein n=1 Tax=Mycobacterium montefiorense TaxID=154654 RepID=A0AA37PMM5_9MYCO|nr:hypothetical protein MmonteBS_04230 [Mycobacterium montefiorense]GKU34051.1 hypothetical protein NJB14191_13970 [Mycobacterium montefiorense]GKU41449.1 hypothetical protein NJB14192_34330 [Mycobacterium montefiorense]GKU47547.1 hypothetical protein NJB14194_41650 [Mycobacterium montefiorense]GKU52346.1 hypothetical protein NJB14195_35890 [Mycobacterium montefiorense]